MIREQIVSHLRRRTAEKYETAAAKLLVDDRLLLQDLADALEEFGGHKKGCVTWQNGAPSCTCGLGYWVDRARNSP